MAGNSEEDDSSILEDPATLRKTLRTPELPDFDDSQSFLTTPPILNIDYPAELYDDSVEVPFDKNDWQVIDSYSGRKRPPRQNEFLRLLLDNPRYRSYITWLDQHQGLFQILEPDKVAALWPKVKYRQTSETMDYDTFARGVRYYYQSGLMIKTHKKYTFRFNQSTNNLLNFFTNSG
jgi:hypothetical protein